MEEAYYIARMRESLAMSHNAVGSAARLIHLDLAGRYSIEAAMSVSERPRSGCRTIRPGRTSFHIDAHPPAPVRPVACCVAAG